MAVKAKMPVPYQQKKPDGTWFYKFIIEGVEYRERCGTYDRAEAQRITDQAYYAAMAGNRETRLAEGRDGPKDMTIDRLAELFATGELEKFPNSQKETFRRLKIVVDTIGPKVMVSTIGNKVVNDFAKARRAYRRPLSATAIKALDLPPGAPIPAGKPLSASSINGEIGILQWMMGYARRVEEMANLPPVDYGKAKSEVPKKPIRRLTLADQSKLIKAAPIDYQNVLVFALESGLRRENLIELKWSEVDFEEGQINVVQKGGKIHALTMTNAMRAFFGTIERYESIDQVFTFIAQRSVLNPKTKVRYVRGTRYAMSYWGFGSWFSRYTKSMGIKCTIHDLRRTFGSETMAAIGLDRSSQMLGHSDTKVTQRSYAAFLSDEKRDAAELSSVRRAERRNGAG